MSFGIDASRWSEYAHSVIEALLKGELTHNANLLLHEIFSDGGAAWRALRRIASDAELVLKLEPIIADLLGAFGESPDANLALTNFERLCEAFGKTHLIQRLNDSRATIYALIKLLGTSNYAADTLCLHPECLELFFPVSQLSIPKGYEAIVREARLSASVFKETKRKWESLNRLRRRETMRIMAADVLGLMSFEDVTFELSALADAIIKAALDIALTEAGASVIQESCGFLVIALGKLGGLELNYSSDIDLMFTYGRDLLSSWALSSSHAPFKHPKQSPALIAEKLSHTLISGLSEVTDYGHIYRVDLRLRPYGHGGPIALEWNAMMSYYESWARAWERMALIKARPVAGDVRLALRFLRFIESYVYATPLEYNALTTLQEVKRYSEELAESKSQSANVKAGRGGIRDIEFSVQLLQLLFGGQFKELRSANTLRSIDALNKLSLLTETEAPQLKESYIFLRRVEHMLQIVEHLPLRELPTSDQELDALARRMGYAKSSVEKFLSDYTSHANRVRSIYEHIMDDVERIVQGVAHGQGEELSILLHSDERLRKWLSEAGFKKLEKTAQALRLLVEGPARVKLGGRERIAVLYSLPTILKAALKTINPDAAIQLLEQISSVVGNRASFISSLCSNETALQMLMRCISISEFLTELMMRYPEHLEALLREPFYGEDGLKLASEGLCRRAMEAKSDGEIKRMIRRFKHKEVMRIGFLELNGLLEVLSASSMLASVADACIKAAFSYLLKAVSDTQLRETAQMAVLGLGGLGACELHYASDLDLAFVHDQKQDDAERIALNLIHILSDTTEDGIAYRVDVRLRPVDDGLLSHTFDAWGTALRELEPWQLLSLPRMRHICGDEALSAMLIEMAWEETGRQFTYNMLEELNQIWDRMHEAHAPPKNVLDPKHVLGGLSDLQFVAAVLQVACANSHRDMRQHSYSAAIGMAAKLNLLREEDAATMLEAHKFLRAVKALITLLKSPQIRSIGLSDPSFVHLAMHLTNGESPDEAKSQFIAHWKRVTQTSYEVITSVFKSIKESMHRNCS